MSDKLKIFVCTEGKKCPKRGSEDVLKAFEKEIKKTDNEERVRVKGCKCLDLCKKGPSVFVAGDKVAYGKVKPSDAAEIIEEHLKGKSVKRLRVKRK